MEITLAAALLRRKELQAKVAQLHQITNIRDLFEVKVTRKAAHEGIDDVMAQVPKLVPEEVTAAYDWHARRLRQIDLVIQQANHGTKVELDPSVMDDYVTTRVAAK